MGEATAITAGTKSIATARLYIPGHDQLEKG
jgi:hypothetical protein